MNIDYNKIIKNKEENTMRKEKVTGIPATVHTVAVGIPAGLTQVHDKSIVNKSGASGALVRNKYGYYFLLSHGTMASIDQRFARSIATE